MKVSNSFFNKDAQVLARDLLGKVIRVKYGTIWLSAQIIETEAYYLNEKGSHSSLGFTEKRKALFMPAGTIYMYYARGDDSLNISAKGKGNAVLIKSGIPYLEENAEEMIRVMKHLNPVKTTRKERETNFLCSGQTLLCRSLHLKVPEWNQQQFDHDLFYIDDIQYKPEKIIQTRRLGIPIGRDEDLLYRFIDEKYYRFCSDKGRHSNYQKTIINK